MNRQAITRTENALWGLFIGDALAMPVHWYYDRENIRREFDGGVRGYEAPHHPHPGSFMVGMSYEPDVESARRLGRPYDILHEHARFYETSYGSLQIDRDERESQHGNSVPRLEQRYHYHHGLEAGENTLGAHLVRELVRSVARAGEYHPDAFLEGFVHHLSTPGLNRDPYTEIYIRRWFERYSRGLPRTECAEHQRAVWSIGSHGGMIRPMVLSLLFPGSSSKALGMALEHQVLTHRSENVATALTVACPLLHELVDGGDADGAFHRAAAGLHLPAVTGDELFAAYRDHNGPGNIPDDRMWHLHVDLRPEPFDLAATLEIPEEDAVMGTFATACYPEHGLPLALYLSATHGYDLRESLLAGANAGGDNVHRTMVQGLLAGAASPTIPDDLKAGLRDADAIQNEIDAVLALLA
ncbi:MAG: ADP-ribosylglycohydrolase family protein [Spirochaetota bacterium]